MPADPQPLSSDEARVLKRFRTDIVRDWEKHAALPVGDYWKFDIDGLLRQIKRRIDKSDRVKCVLTRAGALALAHHEAKEKESV